MMPEHTPGRAGNLPAQIGNVLITISSLEIAEVCETRHNQVVETIERLFEKGVLRDSRKTTRRVQPAGGGRPTDVYDLTKRDALVVASGYDEALRARLIDRLEELEIGIGRGVLAIPDFTNPVIAARAWADEREARQIAERTKAEIGSRREATAMATASAASRRAHRLEIELDKAGSWASVKRMEKHFKPRTFDWRPLKAKALELGMPPRKAMDPNFGEVNTYPADAWQAVYGLEIPHGAAQ